MELRRAVPSDYGYVITSFISSFREASTHAEDLTGKQIATLLTNLIANDWTCTVAELEGVIAGWIISRPGQHLAWVYTRSMFRRQGLAKLLINGAGLDMGRPMFSPFLPNRGKDKLPLRLRLHHRPFLVIPVETVDVQH